MVSPELRDGVPGINQVKTTSPSSPIPKWPSSGMGRSHEPAEVGSDPAFDQPAEIGNIGEFPSEEPYGKKNVVAVKDHGDVAIPSGTQESPLFVSRHGR